MNLVYKIILVFLLAFLASSYVFSQEPSIKNYDLTKGLPSNECYKIIQDKSGYIWVASDAGLSRYNGYSFQNFTKKEGLPDNIIIHLFEDKKGRIWVVGLNSKIAYFQNEVFYPINEFNRFLERNAKKSEISTIYINNQDELQVAFNVFYPYLLTFSLTKNKIIEQYKIDCNNLYLKIGEGNNFIYGINYGCNKVDDNGYLFKVSSLLTIEQEYKKQKFSCTLNQNAQARINYLFLNKDSIVISINQSLFIFHNNTFKKITDLNVSILSLYKDHKGRIWVLAHNDGVYIFETADLSTGMSQHLFEGYSFSSVMEDKESDFWLSSLKKGVYKISDFDIIQYKMGESNATSINVVTKYKNIIYAGGASKNLYSYNKNKVFEKCLEFPNQNIEIFDMQVQKNKLVIIGTHPYLINTVNNKLDLKNISSLKGNGHYMNYLDGNITNDDFILSGSRKGFIKINVSTAREKTLSSMPPSTIYGLYTDSVEKRIYIACMDGLYFTSDNFAHFSKITNQLLNTRINHLLKKGSLFILSSEEKGLVFWNGKKSWNITKADGLASNNCRKVVIDNKGNIWVATNSGLSKIEVKSNGKYEINNLTSNDGLISDDIYNFSVIDDSVWIPNMNGVTVFKKDFCINEKTPPPIYITSITVDDSLFKGIFPSEIPYHHNYLKINYNGLSYKENGGLIYEYRMIGLDTSWKTTKSTHVQFTSLAAGEYIFEIRAVKNEEIYSQIATFSFVIFPPWYKNKWFIIIALSCVFLLTYLLFQIRFNRYKTREVEKNRLNTLVIETEIKALRAQTNPHFIFNSLNSISLFILKNDVDQAQFYLMRFAQLMRDVLENSEYEVIPLHKEISIIKSYTELELLRFGGKYKVEFVLPSEALTMQIMIPPLILQPIIENAIWHGLMPLELRDGILLVKVEKREKSVIITIEDNGIGIKRSEEIKAGKSRHKTSKGILMTQNRIELFNKRHLEKIDIITTELTDSNFESIGTRVELIIETT